MFELPLHTGTEHADLTWIVLSGLAAFISGIGLGIYNDRLRALVRAAAPISEE